MATLKFSNLSLYMSTVHTRFLSKHHNTTGWIDSHCPGASSWCSRISRAGIKVSIGSIGIKSDLLTILRWSASDLSPCLIRDFLYTVEMNIECLWHVWVECLLSACIIPIALDSHDCQLSRLGLGQQTKANGTSPVWQCSAVLPRLPWHSLDWPMTSLLYASVPVACESTHLTFKLLPTMFCALKEKLHLVL